MSNAVSNAETQLDPAAMEETGTTVHAHAPPNSVACNSFSKANTYAFNAFVGEEIGIVFALITRMDG